MSRHSEKFNSGLYWLYDPLLLGFFLSRLPVFMYQYFTTDKYREDFWQRFGYYSSHVQEQLCPGKSGWIHAVSVGEAVAALPVIKKLVVSNPDLSLIISTVTKTGREMVKKSLPSPQCLFLPFDLQFITERVMDKICPLFILLTETEIWPNLIRSAARRDIPIMIMNGRISSGSYKRYLFVRRWLPSVLSKISAFGMQSARDAERIIELGANPESVFVTGNLKFDQANIRISSDEKESLAQGLNLSPEKIVLMAGSTHRGEDKIIIEAYQNLLKSFRDLVLIIAPRYLTDIPEIESKCSREGLLSERKTQLWQGEAKKNYSTHIGRVIILDTIGELSMMYSLAAVVFVGGSLVPIGGHNLLEPAGYGKPVVFGPHVDNFLEISRLLKECGGGFEINNKEELINQVKNLLFDQGLQSKAGRAALKVIEENRGATDKTLELIKIYLLK